MSSMLSHYVTAAVRHFRRNRITTAINLLCLALGIACFLAAHFVVGALESADAQYPHAERIYVLTQKVTPPGAGIAIPTSPLSAFSAADYLKTDFPRLEGVARLSLSSDTPVSIGATKTYARLSYADGDFFKIFAWRFVQGKADEALADSHSALVTEEAAQRLFGSSSRAMGQTLALAGQESLTITGVIAPRAGLSHFGHRIRLVDFDILAPTAAYLRRFANGHMVSQWDSPSGFTYLLLPADGSLTPRALSAGLAGFANRHVPADEWKCSFDAIPIAHVLTGLLASLIGSEKSGLSPSALLYLLGALVLLVSCVNYANLATAQASTRAREVGMRKVLGAGSAKLITQYLTESVAMALLASVIALATIVPIGWLLAGASTTGQTFAMLVGRELPWVAAVVVAVALVAGSYPSFLLSRISSAEALRIGRTRSGPRVLISLLVAMQFAATSFFLIVLFVISQQYRTLERSVGGMADSLVVVSSSLATAAVDFDTLRNELAVQPHVKSISASMLLPWGQFGALMPVALDAGTAGRQWTVLNNLVGRDYLRTLDLKLLAGRDFDIAQAGDATDFRAIVARESAPNGTSAIVDRNLVEQAGWRPEEAIGRRLYLRVGSDSSRYVNIVGVVETKQLRVMGMGATANLFLYAPKLATLPLIRLDGRGMRKGLEELDAVWDRLAPAIAIKRQFADEVLAASLSVFDVVGTVFRCVAGLALAIALMGLAGMSMHIIGRRTHEIGVRKTLGATAGQVLRLLFVDFSRPVLIANVIAWPLAFLAVRVLLSIFAERVGLGLTPFLVSLVLTLSTALLAVSVQATRAARLNPATVLRYE